MKHFRSLLMIAALAAPAAAQPQTETLTLERAVQLALQQQPNLAQTRANIEAALGRVEQAQVARRPTVNLSATLGAGSSRPCGAQVAQTCGGFFEPTYQTGIGAQTSIRLFDFGQTSANIRAAELTARATGSTMATAELDVRQQVEQAFLEAVARQRLIGVAQATVTSEERHVDEAQRFVAAQAKDPIEVVQAQARLANARSALAQAQSSLAIALANLRASIGWVDPKRAPVPDANWPTPPDQEPPPLPELVERSRKQRPEITQLDLQIAAAEASVTAASRGNRPVLTANASTNWNPGTFDWSPPAQWNASLQLSWRIYDGGAARADTRIARANATSVRAQRDALLISLTSELELARAQIVANRANVQASTEAVTAARAQLNLAEARYRQGLGSQIELADAQVAVTTAEGNIIQAQWQLASAYAQLQRSLGTKQ